MSDEFDFQEKWKLALRRCSRSIPSILTTEIQGFSRLNEQQSTAATAPVAVPLAILAGAGTGKTTTLLGRVQHLLNSGALPDNILLLTFTNKSADDLVERLVGSLGANVARCINCTTIHSFSLAVLRCFAEYTDYDSNMKVADARVQLSILREAWMWSQLEEERERCMKWLCLSPLSGTSWNIIFEECGRRHARLFQECLVSRQSDETAAQQLETTSNMEANFVTSLFKLRSAMDGKHLCLQQGSFQYGHFSLLSLQAQEKSESIWWATPKAWRPEKGVLVSKGAILTRIELLRPLSNTLAVDSGVQLLTHIRDILASNTLAQVKVRFEIPLLPPLGSPASLRAKEDPRWRHKLATRIHDRLYESHRSESCSRAVDRKLELPRDGLKELRKKISVAKRCKQKACDFLKTNLPGDLAFCYNYYQDHMRQRGLVDFQDMLLMASKLLATSKLKRLVRMQVRHLLVDEFQDVSPIQLDVLTPLMCDEPDRSLCVVGDDDQTIYTWNGSTTRIFDLLRERCGQLRTIQLTDNYRSTRSILDVGRYFLAQNTRRVGKELRAKAAWAEGLYGSPPLLIECGHPKDEAVAIVEEMQKLQRTVDKEFLYEPTDFAVLFRCFRIGSTCTYQPLVAELTKRCIPHYVIRDEPFWERSFAQDLLAYLDLASGRDDDSAFLRALRVPPRGCGAVLVARLEERRERAKDDSDVKSLMMLALELLNESDKSRCLSSTSHEGLRNFLVTIEELRLSCRMLPVHEALKKVADRSGYCEWSEKQQNKRPSRLTSAGSASKHRRTVEETAMSHEDTKYERESDSKSDSDLSQADDKGEEAAGDVVGEMAMKLREAVSMAGCYAERWESPYGSTREKTKMPSLFCICCKQLRRSASLVKISQWLPGDVFDKVAACCGVGRLQIQDFMRHVALDPKDNVSSMAVKTNRMRARSKSKSNCGVCISTIHAAKGLEWPVVFIARWNEEILPMKTRDVEELQRDGTLHRRPLNESEMQEFMEEERRVAHVAATRAQQQLILSYVRSFSVIEKKEAKISSIQLPQPISSECSPSAAVWKRVRAKTTEELRWPAIFENEAMQWTRSRPMQRR